MDREEGAGRIGDLAAGRSSSISKTPISSVDPKRFLVARRRRMRGVPLALEVDDRVDEVLERLGPGDRAVLGHVADEDHRDPVALGEVHQAERRFADLADAAGRAVELVDGRGLDRIDDDERRSLDRATSTIRPTSCSARTRTPLARRRRRAARGARPAAGPGPATPRPTAYSTPRAVGRRAGEPGRGLEQERGLADPGLAAEEDERARARVRRRGRGRARRCRG